MNLIFILFASLVFSQEISEVNSTAEAKSDITQALQREYSYLISQKESLVVQKKSLNQKNIQKISELKSQISQFQKKISTLKTKNDETFEILTSLEKKKNENLRQGLSLESSYKKIIKINNDFMTAMEFEKPENTTTTLPNKLNLVSFEIPFGKSLELLKTSSEVQEYQGEFLDKNDNLVSGKIIRYGMNGAIGFYDSKYYSLGPNGEGLLKILQQVDEPTSYAKVHIFETINKASVIKFNKGFVEKLSDMSPLLFLGFILFIVLGLFGSLIKI